jgi:hypothetical protein
MPSRRLVLHSFGSANDGLADFVYGIDLVCFEVAQLMGVASPGEITEIVHLHAPFSHSNCVGDAALPERGSVR